MSDSRSAHVLFLTVAFEFIVPLFLDGAFDTGADCCCRFGALALVFFVPATCRGGPFGLKNQSVRNAQSMSRFRRLSHLNIASRCGPLHNTFCAKAPLL